MTLYDKLIIYTPPVIESGIIFQFLGKGAKRAKNLCNRQNHWLSAFSKRAKPGLIGG